ncbi:Holliday junction branch migration protein RuvA [Helicobacter mustelae]|uniref:Holliday junction branch migration complex subunit RuvA n=1 Tax=Helicobacter mustelae (strain ATCC 43772 / CCUG 25715 / CIP 103759 / LMG 18044 / NCTC 12198 / R85-136P) TaxID=679897 RepID=D3UGR1_HELM1|nr:Holliday junction branch migration protein RuvA [Helicobacter mustelae]CBG39682.1 holliday junction DNA helicase [Helicobacter mustelae 12198]SQH71188.1 Holliday junction DNA helicase [Helicobacter mustelae]STP12315.1 Holliday junction DNA helicase [Helicobacter mustelae]
MIFALKGKVFALEPAKLLLDVHDVIYEIHISFGSAEELQGKEEALVYISQIIREDAHLLFGFVTPMEKQIFDTLIKINGVGPKVALAILSTFSAQEFMAVIERKDIAALQKVPGVGTKSAGKIMVELSGAYVELLPKKDHTEHFQQAEMALENLGYKRAAIQKALKSIKASNVQDIIKEALKLL